MLDEFAAMDVADQAEDDGAPDGPDATNVPQ